MENQTTAPQPHLDSNENLVQNQVPIESNTLQSLDLDTPTQPTPTQRTPMNSTTSKLPLILAGVAILAGIATGFGGSKLNAGGPGSALTGGDSSVPIQRVATGDVQAGQVFGVQDEKTFKDSAEGYLEVGGVDGEGSHHLKRAGGISQTVYLTSSVTDLDKLKGMCVKVWGETFKGQKAGWLMDVGRVQVINTTCEAPIEE